MAPAGAPPAAPAAAGAETAGAALTSPSAGVPVSDTSSVLAASVLGEAVEGTAVASPSSLAAPSSSAPAGPGFSPTGLRVLAADITRAAVLPFTGVPAGMRIVEAFMLIAAGALLVLAARRQRLVTDPTTEPVG